MSGYGFGDGGFGGDAGSDGGYGGDREEEDFFGYHEHPNRDDSSYHHTIYEPGRTDHTDHRASWDTDETNDYIEGSYHENG